MSPDTLEEAAFFQTLGAAFHVYAQTSADDAEAVRYQKERLVMYAMARLLLGIE